MTLAFRRLAALLAILAALPQLTQAADEVVVSALRDPVDKSYRRMIEGVERFE